MAFKQVPVWEGGNGNISLRTVARNEAEALNNLMDMNPLLQAIGVSVAPMMDVEGCKVVALVDEAKFEYGDDRRIREDIEERKRLEAEAISMAMEEERINQERIAEAARVDALIAAKREEEDATA